MHFLISIFFVSLIASPTGHVNKKGYKIHSDHIGRIDCLDITALAAAYIAFISQQLPLYSPLYSQQKFELELLRARINGVRNTPCRSFLAELVDITYIGPYRPLSAIRKT